MIAAMRVTITQNIRADRFVADHLNIGRNEAARLIKLGFVCGVAKPAQLLKTGDEITINMPEAAPIEAAPIVDFEVPTLYEDDEILIVNKPAGLVVHSAPSHKGATLVDWLRSKGFSLSTASGEARSGIVHRIDKETTGALCIAKSNAAHRSLAAQLESREMGRYYLAIVDRALKEDTIVDKPIARHPKERVKMAVVTGGRTAKSAFVKLLGLGNNQELIAAKLFSGRTHQIRVHLQSLSIHIVGDTLYGYKQPKDKIAAIYLHAYLLYLQHPKSGDLVMVKAPLSAPFVDKLEIHKEKLDEILQPDAVVRRFDRFLGLRHPA
ncbi:putative RNA pseudouridine synthase [Campylobacterota bacterium]|nr:putative RNA pseudouridine synthase [Campylobacterota bacterium]